MPMEHLTFDLSRNEAGEMSPTNMNVATLKLVQALAEKKKTSFYKEIIFWEEEKESFSRVHPLCCSLRGLTWAIKQMCNGCRKSIVSYKDNSIQEQD